MAKQYKTPPKRELMAGSRLEIDMLEYSLKEARDKLDKKQEELDRVEAILEQTTVVADQRKEKVENLLELTATLTKRVNYWKVVAIIEAGIIVGQILLKVVV